jgi:hypothetical protein
MFKIETIDEYSPLGNSLQTINQNFSILDTRNCIYDADRDKYEGFFSQIESLSSKFINFTTKNQELSSTFKDTSNLVYNLQDYWLNPITLVYPRTFAQIANYQEIGTWLNNNFSNLAKNQVVKVQFIVKTFDDILMSNSRLEKFSVESLGTLANTYNLKIADIQNYIVLDNHVKTIIATISNILSRLLIKFQLKTYTDLEVLYNSFSVKRGVVSSNLLTTLSYTNLLLVWSFLLQYSLIRQRYINLSTLGIPAIPSNVISKFNTKNIYESFIGDFCFKNTGATWTFLPSCDRNVCLLDQCDDCYDSINVNALYSSDNNCKNTVKYVLRECENVEREPTVHVFNTSDTFVIPTGADYIEMYAWGARGGDDSGGLGASFLQIRRYGGGGSFAYGKYNVIEGDQYRVVCNEFGGAYYGIPNIAACPAGGGLAGVFYGGQAVTKNSYNRALIIAAGGGGAVSIYNSNQTTNYSADGYAADDIVNSGGSANMQGVDTYPNFIVHTKEVGGGGGGYRGGNVQSPAPGINSSAPGKGGTSFKASTVREGVIIKPVSDKTTANTGITMASELADVSNKGGVVIVVHYDTNFIIE